MKPEQFQRARRLFDEAMTRETDARAAFLAEACPDDPEVRAEVEQLLAHQTEVSPVPEIHGAIRNALEIETGPGAVVSHYRLETKIGAGGMGDVFLATDLALGREAAIKVLPPGLAGSYRDRLLAEAKTSARLQHPGIATFFEGGETDDGIAFLAMEYVDGQTLRSLLRRGPLAVDEALRIAAALLEALAHAHAHDVIHRDIKPENVMHREGGTVKLLDFGIAKRVDVTELALDLDNAATEETRTALTALTRHGSVVGTIGYMPPEQLRGDPVDARADVFAVGAVLYEMIAGRPAFRGQTAAQRIAATVSGDLTALDVDGGGPDLDAVVRRALARDPAERYGSASEFLRDLQALASGEAIAILPDTIAISDFSVNSSEEDDAWIGIAVADSLAADLARVEGLTVLAREKVTRTGRARNDTDPIELGLALGCRWVLDGAVQRVGPTVRITHQLFEVATGHVAHTGKFDGELTDLFSLQDRAAVEIAEHLHLALPKRATGRSAEHDLDAHECYLRAKAIEERMERGRLDEIKALLDRAIELEPDHADALAALAWHHAPGRWVLNTDPAELDTAIALARRAIRTAPDHALAHTALGYALFRQRRSEEALAAFHRVIEVSPRHLWAHYFSCYVNIELGEFERAVAHARQSISSDTPTPFAYVALGCALLSHGDLTEALWALRTAEELESRGGPMSTVGAGTLVCECLFAMGRLDAARTKALSTLELIEQSDHPFRDVYRTATLCTIGRVAAKQSDRDAARAALTQCVAHLRGRPRGSGLGFVLVTALAALARIDGEQRHYDEALRLYVEREGYDFHISGLGAFFAHDELVTTATFFGREQDTERIRAAAAPKRA